MIQVVPQPTNVSWGPGYKRWRGRLIMGEYSDFSSYPLYFIPTAMSKDEARVPGTTERKPTRSPKKLRRRKYGIYEIAFEDDASTQCLWFPNHIPRTLEGITRTGPYAIRLFMEIWTLAPAAFCAYMLSVAWSSVSSAVNLYFLSVLLHLVSSLWRRSVCLHSDLCPPLAA